MKDATVTINYSSFQSIKEKADKYVSLVQENEVLLSKEADFIERLCNCLEKANEQNRLANKQFFIAQGILAICERFEMNVDEEFKSLDLGTEPKGYK